MDTTGDRQLLAVIGEALEGSARRAGSRLACRRGCTECCIGPFPINMLDRRRLREGLEELTRRDAARAARVIERARLNVEAMAQDFPGDAERGLFVADEAAEEAFCARWAAEPCPALDPETGACDLYDWRPLSCRTYGPPVRIGGEDLPPCRLCFVGAPAAEVEACRVEIDPSGMEDEILTRMEAERAPRAQTAVAFALACDWGTPPSEA